MSRFRALGTQGSMNSRHTHLTLCVRIACRIAADGARCADEVCRGDACGTRSRRARHRLMFHVVMCTSLL